MKYFHVYRAGKVFPKLRRKASHMRGSTGINSGGLTSQGSSVTSSNESGSVTSHGSHDLGSLRSQDSVVSTTSTVFDDVMISGNEDVEATDYVFRIVSAFKPQNLREFLKLQF